MCTLGEAADVNPVIKFLQHALKRVSQELVDMLPFGVTIPATAPQGSEIPEGLMNNPLYNSNQFLLPSVNVVSK
jgi:hypothetical protein